MTTEALEPAAFVTVEAVSEEPAEPTEPKELTKPTEPTEMNEVNEVSEAKEVKEAKEEPDVPAAEGEQSDLVVIPKGEEALVKEGTSTEEESPSIQSTADSARIEAKIPPICFDESSAAGRAKEELGPKAEIQKTFPIQPDSERQRLRRLQKARENFINRSLFFVIGLLLGLLVGYVISAGSISKLTESIYKAHGQLAEVQKQLLVQLLPNAVARV